MQLADVGLVRSRLTLPDDQGVNDVIGQALDAATLHIESILQTTVARNSYADIFRVDSMTYGAYGGLYRLKLSNGFVDPTTVVVEVVDLMFVETPAWVQLAASDYLLSSAGKGFLDLQESAKDQFVRVTYEAGFADDLDVIPSWLQEVAFSHAVKMMSLQQVGDEKPAMEKVYAMLEKHKVSILDRHLRMSSRAIPPISSV